MKRSHAAGLLLTIILAACAHIAHGRAVRTVSATTHDEFLMEGRSVSRVVVAESRLEDSEGRQWTESAVSSVEPVQGRLAGLEAELFQESLRKSADGKRQAGGERLSFASGK